MNYVTYDIDTGEILTRMESPSYMADLQKTIEIGVLEGEYKSNIQYIVAGEVVSRPELILNQNKASILADGIDEWVLSGLPVGSLVTWPDNEVTTVDDGIIEFSVDVVGTYVFSINAFPYLLEEVSIEAIT